MDTDSPLMDLIEALEQGNRYHISIEFFNKSLQKHLQLPRRHIVHATAFCDCMKQRPGAMDRCIRCKGKAIDKARGEKEAFAGLCTFGAFEACYPVFRGDVLLCIVFVGNIIGKESDLLSRSGLGANDPILDTMHRNMTEADCLKVCSVVASYITLLYDSMPEARENSIHATIAAVRSYVDTYFFHEISLTSLAKLYHYNEKYLGTLFKKQTGVSFLEYLNSKRLKHARMLLESSPENIMDIAIKSGFNNVTYFNRLFKSKYGMTPSKYRASCKK